MPSRDHTTTYDQVVYVTHKYLGPAANRFIARQVENHLHKSPSNLSKKDLVDLIDWIRVAVSLLTEDSRIVEAYIDELLKLTEKNRKGNKQ